MMFFFPLGTSPSGLEIRDSRSLMIASRSFLSLLGSDLLPAAILLVNEVDNNTHGRSSCVRVHGRSSDYDAKSLPKCYVLFPEV